MTATVTGFPAWLRRVAGLVHKEMLQIRRDPSSYLIAGLLPLLLLFIFGYGITLDLRRVPVAVVIEQSTPDTASLLASFHNSPYFKVIVAHDRRQVEDELVAGRLKGVVVLAADFTERRRTRRIRAGASAGRWQRPQYRRPGPELCPRRVEQLAGARDVRS